MLPGEREMKAYARGKAEGVRVAAADLQKLKELAGSTPAA
jgi:LDH2 family malate/lactate/ureidoglycolate dehydrogenase